MIGLLIGVALAASETPGPGDLVTRPGPAPVVTQPVWLKLPNAEDMARFRPESAVKPGRAVVECRVSDKGMLEDCHVLEETPGEQYGPAALQVAALFQMGPLDRAGAATVDRAVRIPVTWSEQAIAAYVRPEWADKPTADDMVKVYPPQALRVGMSGGAVIVCQLSAAGGAENCTVADETPAGMGFGKAALRLAPTLRFTTKDKYGKSIVGATFRIPLSWTPPPGN